MGRILAFLLGIAGALVGSQGPAFTLQYMQNLQGRVDELRPIVEQYDADIAQFGYTREAAVEECKQATALLEAMCGSYRTVVERYEYLTAHLTELEAADPLVRPLLLSRTYDNDIVLSVREQYEPAAPATMNGAIYAGGGFIVLWGLPLAVFTIIGSMFGGRRYA